MRTGRGQLQGPLPRHWPEVKAERRVGSKEKNRRGQEEVKVEERARTKITEKENKKSYLGLTWGKLSEGFMEASRRESSWNNPGFFCLQNQPLLQGLKGLTAPVEFSQSGLNLQGLQQSPLLQIRKAQDGKI